jgi:hypothetical protein
LIATTSEQESISGSCSIISGSFKFKRLSVAQQLTVEMIIAPHTLMRTRMCTRKNVRRPVPVMIKERSITMKKLGLALAAALAGVVLLTAPSWAEFRTVNPRPEYRQRPFCHLEPCFQIAPWEYEYDKSVR